MSSLYEKNKTAGSFGDVTDLVSGIEEGVSPGLRRPIKKGDTPWSK
jgi:hypothetical protein